MVAGKRPGDVAGKRDVEPVPIVELVVEEGIHLYDDGKHDGIEDIYGEEVPITGKGGTQQRVPSKQKEYQV